ncbi:hypothetical protein yc1106_07989 [Curvularia clavata]|uniref:WD40 repeat-like protein n=1 Tax=Curvularia clavata TaxID=95742 RepID=A0A9Q8ZEF2_CURCL|nr:hypothetical protein yc1106_07989 [Curvularia clavata]
MNGQAIPGYYWDAEKKKYFKIQSQNAARGFDLKYSLDNIRKEERKQRIQKAVAARSDKIRKERVVRRNLNSITQTNIDRELGSKRSSVYLSNLWTDACAFGIDARPKQVVSRRADSGPIRLFDLDPVSGAIYAVYGSNSVTMQTKRTGIDSWDMDIDYSSSDRRPLENTYACQEVERPKSTVSSLTYLPATGALAVTTYGSDYHPEILLSDPGRDRSYGTRRWNTSDRKAIWTTAARPTTFTPSPYLANTVPATYTEHLAIGTSNSLILFMRSESGFWNSTVAAWPLKSDVLALDWLSYTTVVMGSRDGSIRLYDTRSKGSSHILTHPYPISKLKRAENDTRLVCSGLQNSLCLYDLRSPRQTSFSHTRDAPKRRKVTQKRHINASQPLFAFEHANRDELDLDVAVHARLGLVAAAQDLSTGTAIRISNLYTGKVVKEIKSNEVRGNGKGKGGCESIRSLKFLEGSNGDDVRLWSCWDGGIAEFSW